MVFFWVGDDTDFAPIGDGTSWEDGGNWSNNTGTDEFTDAYIDFTLYDQTADIAVEIDAADAVCRSFTISNSGGGTSASCTLNGKTLTANGNFTISANGSVIQTGANDSILVAGSWSNGGDYTPNTAGVRFFATSDIHNIDAGGLTKPFNNVHFSGGAIYQLSNHLMANGGIRIDYGTTFDAYSTWQIELMGDWLNEGTFESRAGRVSFTGTDQSIAGGTFYDARMENAGTKTLQTSMSVYNLYINTILEPGTNNILCNHDWVNNGTFDAAAGRVIFDPSAGGADISGGSKTIFNEVYIQGTQGLTFNSDADIKGYFNIASSNNIIIPIGTTVYSPTGTNTFAMSNGNLYLRGDANSINAEKHNFPINFGTYQLSGGSVRYDSDDDQDIVSTTYYNLFLEAVTNNNATTKTALGNIYCSTNS